MTSKLESIMGNRHKDFNEAVFNTLQKFNEKYYEIETMHIK